MGKKSKRGSVRAGPKHAAAGQGKSSSLSARKSSSSFSAEGSSYRSRSIASREDLSTQLSLDDTNDGVAPPPAKQNFNRLPPPSSIQVGQQHAAAASDKENSSNAAKQWNSASSDTVNEAAKREAIERIVSEELRKRQEEQAEQQAAESPEAPVEATASSSLSLSSPDWSRSSNNGQTPTIKNTGKWNGGLVDYPEDEDGGVFVSSGSLRDTISNEHHLVSQKSALSDEPVAVVLDVTYDEEGDDIVEHDKTAAARALPAEPVKFYAETVSSLGKELPLAESSSGIVDLHQPADDEAKRQQKDCACTIL